MNWRTLEKTDTYPYCINPDDYYKLYHQRQRNRRREPRIKAPGQVFVGKDGKVWEVYLTKTGKISVRPYKK